MDMRLPVFQFLREVNNFMLWMIELDGIADHVHILDGGRALDLLHGRFDGLSDILEESQDERSRTAVIFFVLRLLQFPLHAEGYKVAIQALESLVIDRLQLFVSYLLRGALRQTSALDVGPQVQNGCLEQPKILP